MTPEEWLERDDREQAFLRSLPRIDENGNRLPDEVEPYVTAEDFEFVEFQPDFPKSWSPDARQGRWAESHVAERLRGLGYPVSVTSGDFTDITVAGLVRVEVKSAHLDVKLRNRRYFHFLHTVTPLPHLVVLVAAETGVCYLLPVRHRVLRAACDVFGRSRPGTGRVIVALLEPGARARKVDAALTHEEAAEARERWALVEVCLRVLMRKAGYRW